jgi:biotin carboxyl carrier protein
MTAHRYRVSIGDRQLEVEVETTPGSGPARLVLGDRHIEATLSPPDASGLRRLSIGDRTYDLLLSLAAARASLAIDGVTLDLEIEDERAARLARFGGGAVRAHGPRAVKAPMPGLVVRVNVEPGQQIEASQSLVVLQAMKMENELSSPAQAIIARVHVTPGQAVDQGQILIELE